MKKGSVSSAGYGPFGTFSIALLLTLFFHARASARAEFSRMGYINYSVGQPWKNYPRLFDRTYTHIIATFLIPASDGTIDAVDAADSFGAWVFPDAQAAGSKVLVSIGGSTVSYQVYIDISGDPAAKQDLSTT